MVRIEMDDNITREAIVFKFGPISLKLYLAIYLKNNAWPKAHNCYLLKTSQRTFLIIELLTSGINLSINSLKSISPF